ncbi:variant surface glycoprotein (VSG, atypical), putative [Trypanosoma brucei brucei TREU927]|uniref:Variant surface glycoprotein (VSG, atypical), putative n=1 Tax=Trypanosoma brucei brucei (strain 927/4 GUTat10.1) TaxID=185431 RepID=Q38G47_TRYB2|nr:variant surface glycoprotein [Trypanosoma brucei brucei TREU927]EAN76223.1 variant surface glycoprotein (VSG, atypical), putative [Trypanosoma brucei brucei TREU927]
MQSSQWLQPLVLFVMTVILATALKRVDAATGVGIKKSTWEPLCQVSEELDGIAGHVLQEATEMIAATIDFDAAAKRARIFSLKNPMHKWTKAAITIATAYEAKAAAAVRQLKDTYIKQQVEAASRSAYVKGRVDDFLKLLEQTVDGSNNACLLADENADTPVTRSATTKLGQTECKLTQSSITATRRTPTHITTAGYINLVEGTGGDKHQPTAASKECHLTTAHTSKGFAKGEGTAAAVTVMAGYLTIPNSAAELTAATKANLITASEGGIAAWSHAHAAIKLLDRTLPTEYANESGDLTERAALKEAAQNLFGEAKDHQGSDGKKAIEAVFSNTKADTINTIITLIEKEDIPKGAAARPTPAKLGEIKNSIELTNLLSYYQQRLSQDFETLDKRLEESTKHQDPKATEKICGEAKDDEDKCKGLKDKGCSFNEQDKKCELKKDVKEKLEKSNQETEGNDGKRTNTTGSNSILIHKSPLLLVVLLLK